MEEVLGKRFVLRRVRLETFEDPYPGSPAKKNPDTVEVLRTENDYSSKPVGVPANVAKSEQEILAPLRHYTVSYKVEGNADQTNPPVAPVSIKKRNVLRRVIGTGLHKSKKYVQNMYERSRLISIIERLETHPEVLSADDLVIIKRLKKKIEAGQISDNIMKSSLIDVAVGVGSSLPLTAADIALVPLVTEWLSSVGGLRGGVIGAVGMVIFAANPFLAGTAGLFRYGWSLARTESAIRKNKEGYSSSAKGKARVSCFLTLPQFGYALMWVPSLALADNDAIRIAKLAKENKKVLEAKKSSGEGAIIDIAISEPKVLQDRPRAGRFLRSIFNVNERRRVREYEQDVIEAYKVYIEAFADDEQWKEFVQCDFENCGAQMGYREFLGFEKTKRLNRGEDLLEMYHTKIDKHCPHCVVGKAKLMYTFENFKQMLHEIWERGGAFYVLKKGSKGKVVAFISGYPVGNGDEVWEKHANEYNGNPEFKDGFDQKLGKFANSDEKRKLVYVDELGVAESERGKNAFRDMQLLLSTFLTRMTEGDDVNTDNMDVIFWTSERSNIHGLTTRRMGAETLFSNGSFRVILGVPFEKLLPFVNAKAESLHAKLR